MKCDLGIINGTVVNPVTGTVVKENIYVKDGEIIPCSKYVTPSTIIDGNGLIITPRFMDIHVHIRGISNSAVENLSSVIFAAKHGGFRGILVMPNLDPPLDSEAIINKILSLIPTDCDVNVFFAGSITKGRKGKEIANISDMVKAGIRAITDDGSWVKKYSIMKNACRYATQMGIPVFTHAIDMSEDTKGVMHEGKISRDMKLAGISLDQEIRAVKRDLMISKETGCRLHIQHVSCAEVFKIIEKARKEGVKVTCEVTPHHLALTDRFVPFLRGNAKMNPPVRDSVERRTLRILFKQSDFACFATDHAPHFKNDDDLDSSPFGVIGLETAIPVTFTICVKVMGMSILEWVKRWTTVPASIIGVSIEDFDLSAGRKADMLIIDTVKKHRINSLCFLSKSKNTPFDNWALYGFPYGIVINGKFEPLRCYLK